MTADPGSEASLERVYQHADVMAERAALSVVDRFCRDGREDDAVTFVEAHADMQEHLFVTTGELRNFDSAWVWYQRSVDIRERFARSSRNPADSVKHCQQYRLLIDFLMRHAESELVDVDPKRDIAPAINAMKDVIVPDDKRLDRVAYVLTVLDSPAWQSEGAALEAATIRNEVADERQRCEARQKRAAKPRRRITRR